MKLILTVIGALTLALVPVSEASLALGITGGNFLDRNGLPTTGGTLFQLVNLGPDGVFNPIDINDGTTNGLERWASGDDSVMNATLLGSDFANTTAFDLNDGADGTPGFMDRILNLDVGIPAVGTKFGIRWFPGLQATNIASITLAGGQFYGQFTRQTEPNGLDAWVIKGGFGNYTLEPLFTTGAGGSDLETAGSASRAEGQVLPVPEPASIALALMGAAGLAVLRRRRS